MGVYSKECLMKVFLNGVEYRTYRKILSSIGARYGCLNYSYLWSRTPKFDISDCDFLEELMVEPGVLPEYAREDYEEFLSVNADRISFSIDFHNPYQTIDNHILVVNPEDLLKPFAKLHMKDGFRLGLRYHGVNCELPFFESMNSSTWMRGTAGYISHFNKKNVLQVHREGYTASAFARELVEEGYKIDLNKVKRGAWQEIAKVNGIAWKKYQDWRENG